MRRRAVLGSVAAMAAGVPGRGVRAQEAQDDAAAWAVFKRRFVAAEGRVVDTGNHDVSHTEGQGWGLLFSVVFDDVQSFDLLLGWTDRVLRRPGDALHAWRYVPGTGVPDPNNATDGDLFIAYAMTRAAARWGRPSLLQRAEAVGRAVLELLVVQVAGRTLLAPGVNGFRKEDGLVINPSYYAFPALAAVARVAPDVAWDAVRRDGIAALGEARFGPWGLPSDWVMAKAAGGFEPAPGFPPRFGYDAIRVPLYLAWAGIDSPVRPAVSAWLQHASPPPAWVDVSSGAVAPYAAGPGMLAAMELAGGVPSVLPAVTEEMDYYTAALCLLARVAVRDLTEGRTAAGPR